MSPEFDEAPSGPTDADEAPTFAGIASMTFDRLGLATVAFTSGRVVEARLPVGGYSETSVVARSAYLPAQRLLRLETIHGDVIDLRLPSEDDVAPTAGRATIYLDQNHWSTLTNALYAPERVRRIDEREAAAALIDAVRAGEVIVPMSSAHMSETCQQADPRERYRRALTIAQLSGGWQLRDPLDVRPHELEDMFAERYGQSRNLSVVVVTLEPDAVHAGADNNLPPVDDDLPADARWAIHALRCAGGNIDAMLDTEHCPMNPVPGWTENFQQFSRFLGDNPTGPELKRRRTHLKFMDDLGRELAIAAHNAGITADDMSDWVMCRSFEDAPHLRSLGVYREVMHIKLCDPKLRWEMNDLIDMMYLTTAAGYCDHVVAERSHGAHLRAAARSLNREVRIHRDLVELMTDLNSTSKTH